MTGQETWRDLKDGGAEGGGSTSLPRMWRCYGILARRQGWEGVTGSFHVRPRLSCRTGQSRIALVDRSSVGFAKPTLCFVEPDETSRARKKGMAPKDYPGTRFAITVGEPKLRGRHNARPAQAPCQQFGKPAQAHCQQFAIQFWRQNSTVLAPETLGPKADTLVAPSGWVRSAPERPEHPTHPNPHAARASHALADPFDRFYTEFGIMIIVQIVVRIAETGRGAGNAQARSLAQERGEPGRTRRQRSPSSLQARSVSESAS